MKIKMVLGSANNINIPYLQKLELVGHAEQLIKGCLCYRIITSQNVSCEAQIKNFFIL